MPGALRPPSCPHAFRPALSKGREGEGRRKNPPPGRAPHPEQGPRLFPHGDAQPTQEPPREGPPLPKNLPQPRFPSGIPSYATSQCPSIDFATPLPHPFPEPLDTECVPRQVSTASLPHLPARPLQAASGHPGGAGGDGQGGWSWRASGDGLGGGLVWRPGVLPLFAEERRGDRGKTSWSGPVGESDWGGHAGEAAGKGGRGA